MNKKKCLLIINPISGTGNKRGLDSLVASRLAGNGLEVEAAWTTAHGDATRLARRAAEEGYDSVIAAGGDGTINETASALCGSKVKLGIIPCGSGNGLARHLDIPVDTRASLEIIARDCPVACDYGSVNGRPFFCTFGVGFDAAVSDAFARGKHRGLVSYVNNTIRQFVNYSADEYTIRANGQIITEQAFLVAVCNASQYGNNVYIAPKASMTDGLLDITIIHAGNPLSTMLVGVDTLTGYTYRNALVDTIRVASATIERKHPGPAHIDGEPVALGETLDIQCHPGQLWLYSNPDERPFRPIITPIASMIREARYSLNRLFHPSLR